jgi:enoyl-CoA hydratase/carnithine racemase
MSSLTEFADGTILLNRPISHVAVLRLNRPQARNAISAAMARAIEQCVDEIEGDPDIRIAIVAAKGPSFCAGADLKTIAAGEGASLITERYGFAGFVHSPRKKPWIAAVHGAAHAGGAEIALACDMIIASTDANFALPEVKRGVIAGSAGSYRITRLLPRAIALELVATGAPMGAQRAYDLGMVNRVVPADRLLDEAFDLARAIAENSPMAVREGMHVTRSAADRDEDELRRLQDEALERLIAGPDMIEGAKAFVEKRAPVWRT